MTDVPLYVGPNLPYPWSCRQALVRDAAAARVVLARGDSGAALERQPSPRRAGWW